MAMISKSELIKLQKQLRTDDAIGKKFGKTRQTVHQWRKKYGIESSWAKNDERNKEIRIQYKSGKTGTEIAKKLELSISQTYRIIAGGKAKSAARKRNTSKRK